MSKEHGHNSRPFNLSNFIRSIVLTKLLGLHRDTYYVDRTYLSTYRKKQIDLNVYSSVANFKFEVQVPCTIALNFGFFQLKALKTTFNFFGSRP